MIEVPDTREEAAAKLPALHVMMVMGWRYLGPSEALALRGSERAVLLLPVLREWLEKHRFHFKGREHALSPAGIDAVIREVSSTGLSEGLLAANRALYVKLTKGVTVTEFVDGQKTSVTVPLIDWSNVDANPAMKLGIAKGFVYDRDLFSF